MQIDLLVSKKGEAGLVSTSAFPQDVAGVIYDVQASALTLEFGAAMDSMTLNIPVADDYVPILKSQNFMHICAIERGRMVYAAQVPLMKVSINDDDWA